MSECGLLWRSPLWAGLHVALLQLGLGLGVLGVTLAVVLRQDGTGADVRALGRVELVAWNSQHGIRE